MVRFFVWYLKRKGYVVLLLDTAYRHCGAVCWLDQYRGENATIPPQEAA